MTKNNRQTKIVDIADSHNPIIALLKPFYAVFDPEISFSRNAGLNRTNDGTIRAILNFLASNVYRQLYETLTGSQGSFDNVKTRMDNSSMKWAKMQEEYRDTPDAMTGDPRAHLAAYYNEVDTARFECLRELLNTLTDAYASHTGETWRFTPPANAPVASASPATKKALDRFLAKFPAPAPLASEDQPEETVAA